MIEGSVVVPSLMFDPSRVVSQVVGERSWIWVPSQQDTDTIAGKFVPFTKHTGCDLKLESLQYIPVQHVSHSAGNTQSSCLYCLFEL